MTTNDRNAEHKSKGEYRSMTDFPNAIKKQSHVSMYPLEQFKTSVELTVMNKHTHHFKKKTTSSTHKIHTCPITTRKSWITANCILSWLHECTCKCTNTNNSITQRQSMI